MKIAIGIFLFILSVSLIGQNLDKPFWGEHDWNGVRYGNIARNYLRYGLFETKLGQVENSGYVGKEEFEYYTHYPPLLPLSIAFSYRFFGISEWSTRLVPLIFTSLSIVLIFLIGSKLWDLRIGVMASALALATPMVLYFGKNASHESLTLFLIMLSFFGYLQFFRTAKLRFKILFILGLILSEATVWAGYLLVPAITVVSVLRRDWIWVKAIIPYWFLSAFIFLIHLGHVHILTGTISGGDLFGSFLLRSGISQSIQPEGFNFINYLNTLRLWFSTLFTLTLVILAIGWFVARFRGIQDQDWPILTLGMVGLIYILVFSNSVFIHNYLIIYFLPFLALSAALTIDMALKKFRLQKFYLGIVIIIILAVFFERKAFLLALNKSSGDKFAVEIGKAINIQTQPEDKILVSPLKFSYSADKFLRFYSDRKLVYSDDAYFEHDVRVIVDQDKGKFEIILGGLR